MEKQHEENSRLTDEELVVIKERLENRYGISLWQCDQLFAEIDKGKKAVERLEKELSELRKTSL